MSTKDLSHYTVPELLEALGTVDGTQYPENKLALERELESRRESGEYALFEQESAALEESRYGEKIKFAKRVRTFTAGYLVLSSSYVLTANLFSPPQVAGLEGYLVLGFAVLYLSVAGIGGVALARSKSWATPLCIGVLCFQLPLVQTAALKYQVLSALGFYVTVGAGGTIGVHFALQPGVMVLFNTGLPFLYGVNLFAAALIHYLVVANEKHPLIEAQDALREQDPS